MANEPSPDRAYSPPMAQYVIAGGRPGYERLQILADAWAPTTKALLDRAHVRPGGRCLDLGTGTGAVAFELADRVGPSGSVEGIDLDPVTIELCREEARRSGAANMVFRVDDVMALGASAEYDLTYCRFLLEHLDRPNDLLAAMWRATRAGGCIVVEDADFEGAFCEPPNAAHAFWVNTYQEVLRRRGGNPVMGRQLLGAFAAAGIAGAKLTVVQRVDADGPAKDMPRLTVEATRSALLEHGVATATEIDAAIEDLVGFAAESSSVVGSPRVFQCWARRRA
jgi:ubiquinone/menaquinone biosynthesis C-methylase UbiE